MLRKTNGKNVKKQKYISLHLLIVFYLTQLSNKQIICFDFEKQNRKLPVLF